MSLHSGSESVTLDAQGQVSWVPKCLSLGSGEYVFGASFPGDKSYQPGGTTFTQTVFGRAVPNPSLVSSLNPFYYYVNPPTLTLTVVPLGPTNYNYPPATGTVNVNYVFYYPPGHIFSQGVESVQVLANGKVTWSPQCFKLGSGTYDISAGYAGDEFYQTGGTTMTQTVLPGPPPSFVEMEEQKTPKKKKLHGLLAP